MKNKIIITAILGLVLFSLLISGLSLSRESAVKNSGGWRVTYSTDKDFFVHIEDKTKIDTEICLLGNEENVNEIDSSKNVYDEKGEEITSLEKSVKSLDGKEYYGYCMETGSLRYVKFGENSTVIIYIDYAEHLDSGKNFIESVTELVKGLDLSFALIPDTHYLKAIFEKNLTNSNEILIYANSSSPTSIGIYSRDDIYLGSVDINKYKTYKLKLNNLLQNTDTFYFKSSGNISYDFVYDPAYCYGTLNNCSDLTKSGLCDNSGCTWNGCDGENYIDNCDKFLNDGVCTNYGCNWSSGACSAQSISPISCHELELENQGMCGAITGCGWYYSSSSGSGTFSPPYFCTGTLSFTDCSQIYSGSISEEDCNGYTSNRCLYDSSAPAINYISPTPADSELINSTNSVTINVSVTEYHLNSAWVDFDANNYTLNCSGAAPDFICSVQLSGLSNNQYSFIAYAEDAGQQQAQTEQRAITINYTSPADPCAYSGPGDWNINCSNNCNITSSVNITGNLIFAGIGNVSLSTKINIQKSVYVEEGCGLNLMRGSGFRKML